jgi:protein-S-isoprenylcysteine O-methyltransferase Ste14
VLATLPGAAIKARLEERLLAEEFGARWEEYARRVPAWVPRLPHDAGRKAEEKGA